MNRVKKHYRHKVSLAALVLVVVMLLPCIARADGFATMRNTYSDSYFGVGWRAGIGGLSLTGSIDAKTLSAFTHGFDVVYFGDFGRRYGFVVGLSLNFLSSGVDAGTLTNEYYGNLPVSLGLGGGTIDMRAHYVGTTSKIKETYSASFLEIPVLFAYSPSENWFMHFGVKFAIPMTLKADYTYGNTTVLMDYVESTGTRLEITFDAGSFDGDKGSYTLYGSGGRVRSVSVMAALEMGYRLHFLSNSSLQFSIYGDYGLGNMPINNAESDLILTLNQTNIAYRGLLNAGAVSGLNYFKAGVRVQYNFGLSHSPRAGNPIRIL